MSAGNGTEVTVVDLDAPDDRMVCVIKDDYNLICDGDCFVDGIVTYANGTHVITIKGVGGAR